MTSKLQRTILIVDDAPFDREAYRRYLTADSSCQYTILEEASAQAGLAVCRSRPIDGILLDFLLPDLNGLEFVAALQQQPGERQPPVIMVTGQGNEAIAARAIKSGVEDYLVKDQITPDTLRCVLHSAIENAELRRKLKQSEERFRTSVENMLDCFGIYTSIRDDRGQIVDFRVDYVNAAACESNHMTKEAQMGRGLCEILPAHRESGLFEEYCRVVETGEPLIKEALFYSDRYGEKVLTRAFDIRVTRLEDGIVAAWRDVTEKKVAEEQVRRDRQFIQRITETVPGLVYVYDLAEQRNVYVNRNVASLLGYTPEQIQAMGGNLFAQLMHPDQLAKLPEILQQLNTLQDGEIFTVEYQMRRADGEWRWFCGYDTIFRRGADGLPQQTLGIVFDITDRKQMELDLRRANERYELAAIAVKGLIYDWDLQRNTVERSQGLFDLMGYWPDEVEPTVQWWQERIHPEDLSRITTDDSHQQINSIERAINEYRVRHRNGHYLWVEDRGYLVRDEAGNLIRFVGSTTNISDRKQAEAALRQSEARLRQLVDCNLVGVLFWNVDGTVYDANDAFLNMIGYTREDLRAGRINWRSLTPPDQIVRSEDSFEQMRRHRSAIVEKNYIRKEGTLVSVLISGVMFEGTDNRGVSFVLDLTERHQVEADLRHSEALFRGIFEANLIGIVFWNLEGQITDANETFLEMTGYSRDQFQSGQIQISDITPPEYHALDEQKIQTLITTGKFPPIEKEYICKDGRRIPVLLGCAFLPGYTDRGVAFVVDISDRKQLEQERELLLQEAHLARAAAETANRTKDEFLAMVSHELRSPLNPILGWTKLLRTREFDAPTIDRALETIERNANAQNQLIEDLLDISRMIRGQLRLNLGCMNLAPLVEHTVQNLRLMAEAKQIDLTLHIQPSPFLIVGDPTRLEQVVTNLLNNAIKFTPSGGRVEVRLELGIGNRESFAKLTVTDTGKGIQPDFLPHIFERFQQAESSTTRSRDGLGLGLAIVRHLVELHGGSVTAASAGEGLGATFTVQIPLHCDNPSSQPSLMSNTEPSGMSDTLLSGLRILVVDDEPDSRDFIQFLLEDSGATVFAAESAQTAWNTLQEHKVDVLLSDITMPGEDGYSLIQRIRQLPLEQGGQILAIALTALAKPEDRDRSLRAGFQHHLSKPIEPDELLQLVREMVFSRDP